MDALQLFKPVLCSAKMWVFTSPPLYSYGDVKAYALEMHQGFVRLACHCRPLQWMAIGPYSRRLAYVSDQTQ